LIDQNSGFGSLLLAILGELPAILFSLYFIDQIEFGRKNTLSYCMLGLGVFNFIAYFTKSYYLGLIISI
jgi:hypothetical protein